MKVFDDLPASPDPIALDERNSYRVNKSLNQIKRLSYLEIEPSNHEGTTGTLIKVLLQKIVVKI